MYKSMITGTSFSAGMKFLNLRFQSHDHVLKVLVVVSMAYLQSDKAMWMINESFELINVV